MNYSIIQLAREELVDYEEEYQGLVKKINLSLFTLPETNLEPDKKKKVWSELLEYTKNIIGKAEKFLDRLDGTSFSEDELVLDEERKNLVQKYNILINNLQKEKETILRQVEKAVVVVTPLRKKTPRLGYCYFCDIDIASGFAYKLKEEEQKVLGIETPKGGEFCSQECLLGYCKEYKNREKIRQEEEKKRKEKIENDRKLVTKIREEMTKTMRKINNLESRERELELSSDHYQTKENPGFFRRLGQKIGIIKKDNVNSSLEEVRKKKGELKAELEKNEDKLQKALVILSIDKQIEQGKKEVEKKLSYQQREKITAKDQEENKD